MNRKQRRTLKNKKDTKGATLNASSPQVAAMFAAAIDHHRNGRLQEAKKGYIDIIGVDQSNCSSYNNLGLIFQTEGSLADAEQMFLKAASIFNRYIDAYNNLGNLYNSATQYDRAIQHYNIALNIDPNNASIYVNRGNALQNKGKFDEALASYQKAVALDPGITEAYVSIGNLCNRLNKYSDAIEFYKKALVLTPDYANTYNNLGYALRIQSRVVQAAKTFERALRIDQNHFDTYVNYGGSHKDVGRLDIAISCYERALSLNPNSTNAMSNLLFAHNYSDTLSPQAISQRHFDIGKRFEARHPKQAELYLNTRDPERRLRVGFVSPDFRRHAVTFFFEPLLRSLDRSKIEVFCYAEVFVPDHITAMLRGLADQWLSTVGMTDEEMATRIRADRVDILVDLGAHTAHSRLPVFARKPAPVQVTWLGYPNTTGLSTIDYRIVDAITDPEGQAEALASETLLRLPGSFLCYKPPPEAPDPVLLPSENTGFVTFGTFSTLAKLSPSTLDSWAEILKRVPDSKLLLKSRLFVEKETCRLYHDRLIERGVEGERIIFIDPVVDTAEHLASYNLIDIALDPFPYNGTTTTCEALWMGVPMVVLAGSCHAGRVGMSLLTQVGMPELIARDVPHYIDIAAGLAEDRERLRGLRRGLRDSVRTSRLCDASAFTKAMEDAYRLMWRRWCAS